MIIVLIMVILNLTDLTWLDELYMKFFMNATVT